MVITRISGVSRAVCAVALIVGAGTVASLEAIDVDVSASDIELVLAVVRGPEAGRTAFHAPYILRADDPVVESIEVITERRRLAQLAEARIAEGDRLFAFGTLRAEEALRPWRRRVSLVARFRFSPLNAYNVAPPIDISLVDGSAPRLDMKGETLFALSSGVGGQQVPVVGARAEAQFDAVAIGQGSRTVVVRLGDREVARIAIDFGRLE